MIDIGAIKFFPYKCSNDKVFKNRKQLDDFEEALTIKEIFREIMENEEKDLKVAKRVVEEILFVSICYLMNYFECRNDPLHNNKKFKNMHKTLELMIEEKNLPVPLLNPSEFLTLIPTMPTYERIAFGDQFVVKNENKKRKNENTIHPLDGNTKPTTFVDLTEELEEIDPKIGFSQNSAQKKNSFDDFSFDNNTHKFPNKIGSESESQSELVDLNFNENEKKDKKKIQKIQKNEKNEKTEKIFSEEKTENNIFDSPPLNINKKTNLMEINEEDNDILAKYRAEWIYVSIIKKGIEYFEKKKDVVCVTLIRFFLSFYHSELL